jgi:Na+/H+-dicarboxylate symporter
VLNVLGKYVACVVMSLLIHGCIILPLIYFFVTKKNPLPFIKGCTQALATAFGTDSSSATLPVSMMCCERNNHVSPLVSKFVLPLAATVNMNGTALYEALTVIFIAQLHGVSLGPGQLVVVALTSTLAAVGAAAIPSAGLVTMVMVLQSAVRNKTSGFTERDTYIYTRTRLHTHTHAF